MGNSLEVKSIGVSIQFSVRKFEGVGRAEYSNVEICGVPRAKKIMEDLAKAIKQSEEKEVELLYSTRESLIAQKESIENKLAEIERSIEKTQEVLPDKRAK